MFERAQQYRGGEGRIHHGHNTVGAGRFRQCWQVDTAERRVRGSLKEQELGARGEVPLDVLQSAVWHPVDLDAQFFVDDLKELDSTAIHIEHRDYLIAGAAHRQGPRQNRSHSTRGDHTTSTALQSIDLRLGRCDGGVGVTRIEISGGALLVVAAQLRDRRQNEYRRLHDLRGQRRGLPVAILARVDTPRGHSVVFFLWPGRHAQQYISTMTYPLTPDRHE